MAAIVFPANPSNAQTFTASNGTTYVYNSASGYWGVQVTAGNGAVNISDTAPSNPVTGQQWFNSNTLRTYIYYNSQWIISHPVGLQGATGSSGGAASVTVYADTASLPLSGNDTGDQAFVTSNNRLYIWNGSGWYNISLVNTAPSIDAGVDASYSLATDGTPTVITITASDAEEIPLTYSYSVTSGALGTTATVSQENNVFTITPGTTDPDDAGTFSLTFTVSDGINTDTATAGFTLAFTSYGTVTADNSGTAIHYNKLSLALTYGSTNDDTYITYAVPAHNATGYERHPIFRTYTDEDFASGTVVEVGNGPYQTTDSNYIFGSYNAGAVTLDHGTKKFMTLNSYDSALMTVTVDNTSAGGINTFSQGSTATTMPENPLYFEDGSGNKYLYIYGDDSSPSWRPKLRRYTGNASYTFSTPSLLMDTGGSDQWPVASSWADASGSRKIFTTDYTNATVYDIATGQTGSVAIGNGSGAGQRRFNCRAEMIKNGYVLFVHGQNFNNTTSTNPTKYHMYNITSTASISTVHSGGSFPNTIINFTGNSTNLPIAGSSTDHYPIDFKRMGVTNEGTYTDTDDLFCGWYDANAQVCIGRLNCNTTNGDVEMHDQEVIDSSYSLSNNTSLYLRVVYDPHNQKGYVAVGNRLYMVKKDWMV